MPYRRKSGRPKRASGPKKAAMPSDVDVCHNQNISVFSTKCTKRLCSLSKPKMQINMEAEADKAQRRKAIAKEVALAVFLFSIVCGCYILYQYLQESMMVVPVVGTKKFDYPVFLVCCCFAINLVTTSILMGGMQIKMMRDQRMQMVSKEDRKGVFHMLDLKIGIYGAIAATSNVAAMTTSLIGIKYLGVPTQIVIKSAKMIPILIGGFILFRKKYPIYDYVSVCVITVCIFSFNYFKPTSKNAGHDTPFGLSMCFVSLLMDGFTGPIEDKMLALKDLHPYLLLFILNFFGFPVAVVMWLVTEGTEPMEVLLDNPQIWFWVFMLAAAASIGQVFIVLCLKLYGSLYTTLITTVRKIVSSLLSIYKFNHPMSVIQWISMAGTFATLMIRQFIKYKAGQKKKQKNEEPVEKCDGNCHVEHPEQKSEDPEK